MLQAQADATNTVVMAELYDRDGLNYAGDMVQAKNYSTTRFYQGKDPSDLVEVVWRSGAVAGAHDLVLCTKSSRVALVFGSKAIRDEVLRLSKLRK